MIYYTIYNKVKKVGKMDALDFTNYNFYSNRAEMELITSIVDSLKEILEEDKKQEQPLFLKIEVNFILIIARKVV